jgi:hypothetical protein
MKRFTGTAVSPRNASKSSESNMRPAGTEVQPTLGLYDAGYCTCSTRICLHRGEKTHDSLAYDTCHERMSYARQRCVGRGEMDAGGDEQRTTAEVGAAGRERERGINHA